MGNTIISILIITLNSLNFAQQNVDGFCITLTDPESSSLEWSDDRASFSFTPSEYFWEVSIKNSAQENLTILWDETLFIIGDVSSKIIFDNTIISSKNEPLSPGIIVPGTRTIKSVLPVENFGSYATNPVYSKKILKRNGERIVTLIIPVLTSDNRHEYKFRFKIIECE